MPKRQMMFCWGEHCRSYTGVTALTCILEKFLTLSQKTNFRLFQTERLCRRQFQI